MAEREGGGRERERERDIFVWGGEGGEWGGGGA